MRTSSVTAGMVLQARYRRLIDQHAGQHSNNSNNSSDGSSIEITAVHAQQETTNTSIELPQEIAILITGSDYWVHAKTNRYKKLIREGYLETLLHLAREAQTKERPANWFAAACSKANWEERTLPYLAKLREVAQKAEQVVRRIGGQVTNFIYKMIWRGVNVERWAVAAQEVRHDQPGQSRAKYFAWLCVNERRLASAA